MASLHKDSKVFCIINLGKKESKIAFRSSEPSKPKGRTSNSADEPSRATKGLVASMFFSLTANGSKRQLGSRDFENWFVLKGENKEHKQKRFVA